MAKDKQDWMVMPPQIFHDGAHWPKLKHLKLQGLGATDSQLKTLLTTHATSLRSLELADMNFHPYMPDGKQCHGSWAEIILFLQCSLSLETVCLNGVFSGTVDEVWCSQNPGEHFYAKSLKSWISARAIRTLARTRLNIYVSIIV